MTPIADDYPAIHARMRELEAERGAAIAGSSAQADRVAELRYVLSRYGLSVRTREDAGDGVTGE